MSDPVTNVEIEDVLSSIRRLVSDGDKARTRDPAPADETRSTPSDPPQEASESEAETGTADRLVLTPAFLVVESDTDDTATADEGGDPAQAEDATWVQGDAPAQDSDHPDGDTTEDFTADAAEDDWSEDSWSEDSWAEEAEADNAADAPDSQLDEDALFEAVSETVAAEPLTLTDRVMEEDEQPEDLAEDTGPSGSTADRSGLVATIAELEAAISSGEDEFEPDGSELDDDAALSWPNTTGEEADSAEDGVFSSVADASQDFDTTADQDGPEAEDWDSKDWDAQGLGPVGRELNVEDTNDTSPEEPADVAAEDTLRLVQTASAADDVPSDDALSGTDESKQDTAEIASFAHRPLDVPPAPEPSVSSAAEAPAQDDHADEDDLEGLLEDKTASIDPEVLRSMVAEVVRQELAGTMGEKITRNVRKLVRREIYRILSSQEFD